MDELQAQRRLVKSPPELWAEVSSEDVLRRHLAPFGAIRITRREPESTVAWEGERASGTVSLDAAGWGTRVTLKAVPVTPLAGEPWVDPRRWVAPEEEPWSPPAPEEPQAAVEPEPEPEQPEAIAEPDVEPEPEPAPAAVEPPPRRGWLARLLRRAPAAEITPPTPPAPPPDPSPPTPRPDPSPEPPAPAPPTPDPTPPIEPPEPAPTPDGPTIEAEDRMPAAEALKVLEGMLDHLGSAHHRPFSRA
jgi:hypothetical protein